MKWITSDHHFGHERIIELERPQFESLTEMDNYMITQWNKVVSSADTVYHLGDFSLGLTEKQMRDLLKVLNGTIILVRGNHDRWGKKKLIDFGFKDVVNRIEMGQFILTHKPIKKDILGGKTNIHGHTHGSNIGHDDYINVSVEQTDYTPVRLDKYIKEVDGGVGISTAVEDEYQSASFTKYDWSNLGINEHNADFVLVEELEGYGE